MVDRLTTSSCIDIVQSRSAKPPRNATTRPAIRTKRNPTHPPGPHIPTHRPLLRALARLVAPPVSRVEARHEGVGVELGEREVEYEVSVRVFNYSRGWFGVVDKAWAVFHKRGKGRRGEGGRVVTRSSPARAVGTTICRCPGVREKDFSRRAATRQRPGWVEEIQSNRIIMVAAMQLPYVLLAAANTT